MYAELKTRPAEPEQPVTAQTEPTAGPVRESVRMNLRTRKTNTMNLLNEALARARMRELWRDQSRYVGRHRGARDISLMSRRRNRR